MEVYILDWKLLGHGVCYSRAFVSVCELNRKSRQSWIVCSFLRGAR